MTWAFSLSVECGPEQIAAQQFTRYFENTTLASSGDVSFRWFTTIFQDIDETWWCRVCPDGVSELGIEAPDSAYLMTELGIALYQRLRSAPSFRYAIVGLEVDEFRTYSELTCEAALDLPGLVLSDAICQSVASSSALRPFSPGYCWQPYAGEIYRPLAVSPALKEQMNRLLVA
ncbi:MAG: hypothetical protein WBB01_20115 [Phormidesmis sp.]